MIQRLIFYVLALFFLASCGSDAKNDGKLKVGFCLDAPVPERWKKDTMYFKQYVRNAGAEVLVDFAKGDPLVQAYQAKEMVDNGVDVLVIVAVDQSAAAEIVEYAHKRKVQVIAYDRLIRDCKLDYYVSFDHERVGQMQAEYLVSLRPMGNYVIIGGGETDNNAYIIRQGQGRILQSYLSNKQIKLLSETYTRFWGREESIELMRHYLNDYPSIDAVLTANDALAEGAIAAYIDWQKEHSDVAPILFTGMDADSAALKRIEQGTQSMTVYKPIDKLAKAASEIAITLAKGEKVTLPMVSVDNGKKQVPSLLLPSEVVTQKNIDKFKQ